MFYTIKYTMPTLKIKTVEDYKTRVNEILSWQIKDTLYSKWIGFGSLFQSKSFDDILFSLGLMLFSIITLPFTLLYVLLCLTELLLETLFLPLFRCIALCSKGRTRPRKAKAAREKYVL